MGHQYPPWLLHGLMEDSSQTVHATEQFAKDGWLNSCDGKMEASKIYAYVLILRTSLCDMIWGKGPLQRFAWPLSTKAAVHNKQA